MLEAVVSHYENALATHGATARGVDWKDAAGQRRRFELLLQDIPIGHSINDLGCGYGAMSEGIDKYVGYDISEQMIAAAREKYPCQQFILGGADGLLEADWTLASGLFNVKCGAKEWEWEAYIIRTLLQMANASRHGIGFNMLCDLATQRREDLYYGSTQTYMLWALNQGWRISVYQDVKHEFTLIARF